MKLSVIIPCYNEENNIELIYEATEKALKQIEKKEIIFIDDGSNDKTLEKMKKVVDHAKLKVKIVSFSRNFGREATLYAGFQNATGEYTAVIDGDMQQDPNLLIEMYDFLEKNPEYDSVARYQEKRKERKFIIFLKNQFYKFMNKISDVKIENATSEFRIFRKSMVDAILSLKEYHRFTKGILAWIGFNTHYMPYVAKKRASGTSKFTTKEYFKYAIEGIIAFSTKPLRLATYIGLLSFIVSIITLLIVMIQKVSFGTSISGVSIIVIIVLLLSSLQLFCLGIIGEYLAKNHLQSKNRPVYIAKEIITNFKD